jgi:hypothetical protein
MADDDDFANLLSPQGRDRSFTIAAMQHSVSHRPQAMHYRANAVANPAHG